MNVDTSPNVLETSSINTFEASYDSDHFRHWLNWHTSLLNSLQHSSSAPRCHEMAPRQYLHCQKKNGSTWGNTLATFLFISFCLWFPGYPEQSAQPRRGRGGWRWPHAGCGPPRGWFAWWAHTLGCPGTEEHPAKSVAKKSLLAFYFQQYASAPYCGRIKSPLGCATSVGMVSPSIVMGTRLPKSYL